VWGKLIFLQILGVEIAIGISASNLTPRNGHAETPERRTPPPGVRAEPEKLGVIHLAHDFDFCCVIPRCEKNVTPLAKNQAL
jgi:hypothetical protein